MNKEYDYPDDDDEEAGFDALQPDEPDERNKGSISSS